MKAIEAEETEASEALAATVLQLKTAASQSQRLAHQGQREAKEGQRKAKKACSARKAYKAKKHPRTSAEEEEEAANPPKVLFSTCSFPFGDPWGFYYAGLPYLNGF